MEPFSTLIAGFAFFLVGIKLFNANLNQLTTAKFRTFIAKFTPNGVMASIWGIILSILTAGNTFLTPCIAAGLAKVKAINSRKALQIVIWSRVGACAYIFIAGFDIKLAVLFALGVSGISFALGKPKRLSTFTASLFNLALVLFGIQLIKGSTKVLVHYEWFNTVIEYTAIYPFIALGAGFLFLLCSQSLFGALVVALSFYSSGIFDLNQVMLFIYGLYLAEAVLKSMYLPAFKNSFKEVIAIFLAMYSFAFCVGIAPYFLETTLHIPLLKALATTLTDQPKIQLAIINLVIHLIMAFTFSFSLRIVQEKFIARFHQPVAEGEILPLDIPIQAIDTPLTTLSLIEKDHIRIARYLSEYMEHIRSQKVKKKQTAHADFHTLLTACLKTDHDYFSKLLNRANYSPQMSSLILTKLECHNNLTSLEESVFHFATLVEKIHTHHQGDTAERKLFNFVEAFDTLLMSMVDLLENPSEHFNEEVIQEMTQAREKMLKNIRNEYVKDVEAVERVDLIELINLFEKSLWLINTISRLHVESLTESDVNLTTTQVASKNLFQRLR